VGALKTFKEYLMTYEEFYQIVLDTCSELQPYRSPAFKSSTNRYWPFGDAENYEVEWCTGGSSGGSCWGDESHEFFNEDSEPDLDLDNLLEKINPNMNHFQYRRLMKDLIERDNRSENEYYGNYSRYGIKRVNYQKLYDKLIEGGIITNE
jgi:hypothetical protein